MTSILGIAFVVVGLSAMFLMYRLWGYPFDRETHESAAPRWAMALHRGLGYAFALIYVVLMWHMVPRLWRYQIEFPARTTFHIVLGFTVGFLLFVKISILRWFRHFEEWMPYLGTMIALCAVLLIGLSLPFALQERALAHGAFSKVTRARVAMLLPTAGLPNDVTLPPLSTEAELRGGREVLLGKCVACHDLKTILAKPRSPTDWWATVARMADKPTLVSELTPEDQYRVTAYLIAITPDLQRATKRKRAGQRTAATVVVATPTPVDLVKARLTFAEACSGCHEITDVDANPPKTIVECSALVRRMIDDNDAKLTTDQVALITAYLVAHYVERTAP